MHAFPHLFAKRLYPNSIEKLSNPGLTRHKASWKLIQPPDSILSPRDYPVVVPLNAFEIAILGDQSNVMLFNIKTETCKKAISDLPYEFYPKRSQAVQIRPNQFVFLRCSFDQNVLVKCIGSERSFKILNKYEFKWSTEFNKPILSREKELIFN